VYAVGHEALTGEGRWLAAVFACGPDAVLSHRSAAALWGIRPSSAPTIDVTVPSRTGRARRAGIVIHRTARLAESETTKHRGIPTTTVARTLVELKDVLPERAVKTAIEEAERLRLFDLASLYAVVERNPGRARVEIEAEPAFTRNDLERRVLDICAGLPRPIVNSRLGDYEPDFLWREQRLIVETDGRETHATRAAFERDRARDAELTADGYRVVRFTWRQVRDEPDRIVELLSRLLG
jgi:hypothetical protein